jgi:hypothetical protein
MFDLVNFFNEFYYFLIEFYYFFDKIGCFVGIRFCADVCYEICFYYFILYEYYCFLGVFVFVLINKGGGLKILI